MHAGGVVVVNPPDGNGALPPIANFFPVAPGRVSRPVSSWFFADGAQLAGEVGGLLGIPIAAQIVSVDRAVAASSLQPRNGLTFGVRVNRSLSPHFRLEGTVDWKGGSVEITDDALTQLDAASNSFATFWRAMLIGSAFQNTTVTSTVSSTRGTAGQLLTIGSIDFQPFPGHDMIPYLTVGAGVLTTLGETPTVSLTGRYTTQLGGVAPIDESDRLTLSYELDKHLVVTVVGVGWRHMLAEHFGVRADLREHLSGNRVRAFVDTNPARVVAANPAQNGFVILGTFDAIQLSNVPGTAVPTTLSGDPVSRYKTFVGTGMESRFAMTAGIFVRF